MALATKGYTENTPKHYLIDSATVFKNVTYTALDGFAGTLIGATEGGVTVTIEQNYRAPEVDGTAHLQGLVKGNIVLESAKAQVVINLKELTAENLRGSLNGTMVDALSTEAPVGYKKITTKRAVASGDYLTNIAVVGTLAGSAEPVIFIIDNPLNTNGVEVETQDNGEAVIELTYVAHATAAQVAADEFPWRILFPAVV